MAIQYQHTQRGTVVLVIVAVMFALFLLIGVWIGIDVSEARSAMTLMAIAMLVVLAAVAWYFSSMTVIVTDDELRWHFGSGRDWRIARVNIERVAIAPHQWLAGYGLRWFGPKRWVYIVSGRDTVEVCLKQGGWRRLGTDDPQGLLDALTSK